MKSQIKTKKVTRKTTAAPLAVAATKPVAVKVGESIALTPARLAPARAATLKPAETTIEAKIDVGFGNNLFLRGQGAGLSWERGTPLTCVDGSTWRWTAAASEPLTVKVLLNDQVWATGEDVVVIPGKRVEIVPAF